MSILRAAAAALLAAVLAGCATTAPVAGSGAGVDYHSWARPDEARVEHVHLDLAVDFDQRILTGSVTLDVTVAAGVRELVLDTRDLDIFAVRDAETGAALKWSLGKVRRREAILGAPLRVALPAGGAATARVIVDYASRPEASGLQWLTAAQTAGKKQPFLFTQSQAIHARSWIPLQDTPAVRVTYTATIRTPADIVAVMSAESAAPPERGGEYSFHMPQAIPSYLIALAAGDLVFAAMSERTGVWAEPALLASATAEFADTEQMLQLSERLFGPYRWGRYDLLILPPSFPFGGMENPRLSFITPTVIAGDKSLVALIAHELAHSWSGNLVSNATWDDLWLNEGFTSFLTTRIMEAVYGERRARMEEYLDYQDLIENLEDLAPADEALASNLRGRDPDEGFTQVPYMKGQLFVMFLEREFGRERLDVFLREYFAHFSFQSITTDQFLAYLQKNLLDRYPGMVSRAEVNAWVYEPGLPQSSPRPESDAFAAVSLQLKAWLDGAMPATDLPTTQWTPHEWLHFIDSLPRPMPAERLRELDAAFNLTNSENNEIAHSWLRVAIRNEYLPAYARLREYLVSIGRRKLVIPLYQELAATPKGMAFARQVFETARPGYHPLTIGSVEQVFASAPAHKPASR